MSLDSLPHNRDRKERLIKKEIMLMGVKDVYREERVSKKGNTYQVIVFVFENGYKLDSFLNNEQQYILVDVPLIVK